ncbi:MAG: hypothetical protein ACYDAI_03120 [Trichloromonadaceae bacterium]
MRKLITLLLLLALAGFTLPGCGGGGGSDTVPSQALQDLTGTPGTVDTPPTSPTAGPPASLKVASSLPAGALLAQNGSTTILATVKDSDNNAVADGTVVNFTTTKGSISDSATTTNGVASTTFQAGPAGGVVTIKATTGTLTTDLSLTVASGPVSSITNQSVTPQQIGVRGGGKEDVSIIVFRILDGTGNTVSDGTTVNFAIATPLGGGEKLSPASAQTVGGNVSVALQSGTIPGIATVSASVTAGTQTIASEARVTIVAGLPEHDHFSAAVEKFNVAGYATLGIETKVTAFVGDRYSNPVPIGTPVSFFTEGGIISVKDPSGNPTNLTNNLSQALATHVTAAPLPNTVSAFNGLIGLSTVLVTTQGQETYTDSNGNGIYDEGELFVDLGEPFIDKNDNGTFDTGEFYVDVDLNGAWSGPNGTWDNNTIIWTSNRILFSANTAPIAIDPSNFAIPNGGSQAFSFRVTDSNGNPLVAGSTVKVTATGGTLVGWKDVVIPDTRFPGPNITDFTFTLADDSATDTDPPKLVSVSVEVTSAANGNGSASAIGTLD